MEENKKEGKFRFYPLTKSLLAILSTIGLVSTACIVFTGKSLKPIDQIMDLVAYLFAIYYFVYGYKKPHSNLLKYVIFLFVIITTYHGLSYRDISRAHSYTLITISIMLAYIAGRLNKFNKNRIIIGIGFILLTISTIYALINFPSDLFTSYSSFEIALYKWSYFNSWFQYCTICLAYLTRCYKHLKAGKLMDDEEEI